MQEERGDGLHAHPLAPLRRRAQSPKPYPVGRSVVQEEEERNMKVRSSRNDASRKGCCPDDDHHYRHHYHYHYHYHHPAEAHHGVYGAHFPEARLIDEAGEGEAQTRRAAAFSTWGLSLCPQTHRQLAGLLAPTVAGSARCCRGW